MVIAIAEMPINISRTMSCRNRFITEPFNVSWYKVINNWENMQKNLHEIYPLPHLTTEHTALSFVVRVCTPTIPGTAFWRQSGVGTTLGTKNSEGLY